MVLLQGFLQELQFSFELQSQALPSLPHLLLSSLRFPLNQSCWWKWLRCTAQWQKHESVSVSFMMNLLTLTAFPCFSCISISIWQFFFFFFWQTPVICTALKLYYDYSTIRLSLNNNQHNRKMFNPSVITIWQPATWFKGFSCWQSVRAWHTTKTPVFCNLNVLQVLFITCHRNQCKP